jgi:hypothetical protein
MVSQRGRREGRRDWFCPFLFSFPAFLHGRKIASQLTSRDQSLFLSSSELESERISLSLSLFTLWPDVEKTIACGE